MFFFIALSQRHTSQLQESLVTAQHVCTGQQGAWTLLLQIHRHPSAGFASLSVAWLICVRSKEYKVALRWLSWLLTERRDDPGLWSIVGYVQLMLGDISVADRTFHKAAELLSAAQTVEQKQRNQAIVRRHQGLLLFARNDFAGQSHCSLCLQRWQWILHVIADACPAQ